MRRLLAGMALLASVAFAQTAPFQPVDTANIAVTGTAQNITLPTALSGTGKVQYVINVIGTQTVFYRCDGVTATAANGMPAQATQAFVITVPASITVCSVIAGTTGSTIYFTVGVGS